MTLRPMRILQILPSLNTGGVEQGTLDISEALRAQGHQSFVCSSGGKGVEVLKTQGATALSLGVQSKNPFQILKNIGKIVEIIDTYGIDLVHVRSRAPAWSAYYACQKARVPLVTTFHGTYTFQHAVKKKYNAIMVRGDAVIAISQFIQDHIHEHYQGFMKPKAKQALIYRGVDLDVFNPLGICQETLHRAKVSLSLVNPKLHWDLNAPVNPSVNPTMGPNMSPNHRIVLLPARFARWKGHEVLIDAFTFLRDLPVVGLLVGPLCQKTSYVQELREKIVQKGLAHQMHLLEAPCPLPVLYDLAHVVVHTSTDPEAFGRVIAEAQAMGKPVISNTLGAPKEILIPHETGWVVPPCHPQKLADKIRFALDLPPRALQDIAVKARERMGQHFSKTRMCSQTLSLYEDLLCS